MKKKEFAAKMAEKLTSKKIDAERAIDAFIETLTEVYDNGERVDFQRFGSFIRKHRNPRTAHCIATGELVNIPTKDVLIFKMSPFFNKDKK